MRLLAVAAFFIGTGLNSMSVAATDGGSILQPTPKASICNAAPLNYPGPLPKTFNVDPDYFTAFQSDPAEYLGQYAVHLTALSARALVSKEAQLKLHNELIGVARDEPLKWVKNQDAPFYMELMVLTPYVIAYAQQISYLEQDKRDLIEGWIEQRLKLLKGASDSSKLNNREYHFSFVQAVYGHATQNNRLTKQAYKVFTRAVRNQRSDGSLPEDSERGGSALHYSSHAIGNLVALADVLELSGINAYDYEIDGKSLHTMVAFLVAADRNPKLIEGYAGGNPEFSKYQFPGTSPSKQAMDWKSNEQIGWAYYYMDQFPGHLNTRALLSMTPFLRNRQIGTPHQPWGHARCYLGY